MRFRLAKTKCSYQVFWIGLSSLEGTGMDYWYYEYTCIVPEVLNKGINRYEHRLNISLDYKTQDLVRIVDVI